MRIIFKSLLRAIAAVAILLVLLLGWGWINSGITAASWKPDANPRDDSLVESPAIRRILAGLPKELWLPEHRFGAVLGFDLKGELTHNLQFSDQAFARFSEINRVQEYNGQLYLGSLVERSLAVLALPE